ncbi:hypothetical protein NLM24_26470 [Nocardia zapadnayensis]|nr:hypothetical protein [Nocardia zapadnayensis]MCX0274171.1 hypothetical protein [Nocardia zapadnayensis]
MIVGLHLSDEVWENTDDWLAREILRVAKLAHVKSQVGRRAELMVGEAGGRAADRFGLPTESDFQRLEKDEFGDGH